MVNASEITEHMEIVGADGVHVGKVDGVKGDRFGHGNGWCVVVIGRMGVSGIAGKVVIAIVSHFEQRIGF